MKKTRFLAFLLAFIMAASVYVPFTAFAAAFTPSDYSGQLVIIHTNDTHGRDLEGKFTTAGVAQLKKDLEAAGASVLLVSAGDASQGTPLVNVSQGQAAIDFLNLAGYDVLIPGNHEYDWGRANFDKILQAKKFDVLSANIRYNASGRQYFEPSHLYTVGSYKVGIVGVTTPETTTKTDATKNKGIVFDQGAKMFADVQTEVDKLKAAGADLIVVVGHLGIDTESAGNRSTDLLAAVTGVDVFIDGHSHNTTTEITGVYKGKTLLVSTGSLLDHIGIVSYDGTKLAANLLDPADYKGSDATVKAAIEAVNAEVDKELGKVIAKTEVLLNGERDPGVRTMETNLGNFSADAILWAARDYYGKVDVAITNGGGIRESIKAGNITAKTMKTVYPFGNTVATITVTGAELLEALEASTFSTPSAIGGFPQVSGLSFTLLTDVEYVKGEQYKAASGGMSTYYSPANLGSRVKDLKIGGVPVDLAKSYVVASNNFTAAGNDTYGVFVGKPINDSGVALEDALTNYAKVELKGVISAEKYGKTDGRINIISDGSYVDTTAPAAPVAPVTPVTPIYEFKLPYKDVPEDAWYAKPALALYVLGLLGDVDELGPNEPITMGELQAIAQWLVQYYISVNNIPVTELPAFQTKLYERLEKLSELFEMDADEFLTFGLTALDPEDFVTRETALGFSIGVLALLYDYKEPATVPQFTDLAGADPIILSFLGWVNEMGIMKSGVPNGDGTFRFAPEMLLTRAQAIQITYDIVMHFADDFK